MLGYSFNAGLKEERLLNQHASIEVLETLKEKTVTPEELLRLRGKIGETKDEEIPAVNWKEALASVDEQSKKIINENLQKLDELKAATLARKDIQGLAAAMEINLKTKASAEQKNVTQKTEETYVSTIKKFAEDTKKDFMDGGTLTKTGYILGAGIGFVGARWLWRKIFGSGENEGWLAMGAKWFTSILATVGGVALFRHLKNADPTVPTAIKKLEDTTAQGYNDANTTIDQNYKKTFGIPSRDQFKNDEEYDKALEQHLKDNNIAVPDPNFDKEQRRKELERRSLEDFQKTGGTIGYMAGSLYLIGKNGMETVFKGGSLLETAAEYFVSDGKERSEAGWELWKIYVAGGTLYLSSFSKIDAGSALFNKRTFQRPCAQWNQRRWMADRNYKEGSIHSWIAFRAGKNPPCDTNKNAWSKLVVSPEISYERSRIITIRTSRSGTSLSGSLRSMERK